MTTFSLVNNQYVLVVDAAVVAATAQWLSSRGCRFANNGCEFVFSYIPTAIVNQIAAKYPLQLGCDLDQEVHQATASLLKAVGQLHWVDQPDCASAQAYIDLEAGEAAGLDSETPQDLGLPEIKILAYCKDTDYPSAGYKCLLTGKVFDGKTEALSVVFVAPAN